MKKNLILTAILVSLLVFTYYFQELGGLRKSEEFELKHRITRFKASKLDEIALPRTRLLKRDGQWMISELNYPASPQYVAQLLTQITSIHQVKQLKNVDHAQYFANQSHYITFKVGSYKWEYRLGDVSESTGNFYFQDLNKTPAKTYLARDTSEYAGVYRTELELMLNKYLQLKDLVTAAPESYIDRNLLREVDPSALKKIKIDNKWNRWFEVDFANNTTEPAPPKGIKYLNFKPILAQLLERTQVKAMHTGGKEFLDTEISDIAYAGDKEYKLKVYGEYKGNKGLFAQKQADPERVFELRPEAKDFIFSNVQMFWDKRIFYDEDVKNLKKFDFKLGDSKTMYQFSVSDVEDFEIDIKDKRVRTINKGHTNFLFHLFFSLTQFRQARSVLDSLPTDEKVHFTLKAEMLGKKLEVAFAKTRVFLVNKSDSYILEYLFPVADYNFKGLNDFFALK